MGKIDRRILGILTAVDTRRQERLLLRVLEEAGVRILYLAVDSVGFSSTSANTYYTLVLEFWKSKLGGRRRGVLTPQGFPNHGSSSE